MKKYRANRGFDRRENGPEYYRNTSPYDYQDEFLGNEYEQQFWPLPPFGGYRDDYYYGNEYNPDYQNSGLRNEYARDPSAYYGHPYQWLQGYGHPNNQWGPGGYGALPPWVQQGYRNLRNQEREFSFNQGMGDYGEQSESSRQRWNRDAQEAAERNEDLTGNSSFGRDKKDKTQKEQPDVNDRNTSGFGSETDKNQKK